MKKKFLYSIIFHVFFICIFLLPPMVIQAQESNIDETDKWAWGTNTGWINFNPTHDGITVYTDHLEGYAWAENIGWIRMGSHAGGGAHTYENTSNTNYGVNNDGNGNLSGFAWGTNIGWINFNPTHGQVTVDMVPAGEFHGYAWSENVGWIHFNFSGAVTYKVATITDNSLPVELSSFSAMAGDGQVTLKWVTESETNNEAFIVERGNDGEQFEFLTEIESGGNSSERSDYSFTDYTVFNGFTYFYRLADRDLNGVITYHSTVNATPNIQENDLDNSGLAVEKFALYNNYPNPFNPETTIHFDVPMNEGELTKVKICIYNSMGKLVSTYFEGQVSGGQYTGVWNAGNQPSGIYFLTLQADHFYQTQKMILVK